MAPSEEQSRRVEPDATPQERPKEQHVSHQDNDETSDKVTAETTAATSAAAPGGTTMSQLIENSASVPNGRPRTAMDLFGPTAGQGRYSTSNASTPGRRYNVMDVSWLPPEQEAAGLPSGLSARRRAAGRRRTPGSSPGVPPSFKVCRRREVCCGRLARLARRSRIERKHALTCGAEGAPGRIRTCDTGFGNSGSQDIGLGWPGTTKRQASPKVPAKRPRCIT